MHRLLIALLVCCQPAHAAMIQYDFTVGDWRGSQREPGDELFGQFWFDDAAPLTSLLEYTDPEVDPEGIDNSSTTATYDASGMTLWAQSGEDVFSFTGTTLVIQNRLSQSHKDEFWKLSLEGVGGSTARFTFQTDYSEHDPLQDASLAAPIFADWLRDPTFAMWKPFSADDNPIGGALLSFAPTSVPEPGTLSLLSVGLLALVGRWRRRPA